MQIEGGWVLIVCSFCFCSGFFFCLTGTQLNPRTPPSPVIGDDVHIHLVVALSVLGQVADGFAVGLLVAVNPVEPNFLLLHLFLQQGRLQGGLHVWDQPVCAGIRVRGLIWAVTKLTAPSLLLQLQLKISVSRRVHTRGNTLSRIPPVRVHTCLKMNKRKYDRLSF